MRTFLKLSLAAMIVWSCATEPKNEPTISGKLVNTTAEWVFVYDGDDVLDSTKLDSSQAFALNTVIAEPGYFTLEVDGQFTDLFLTPTTKVSFSADGNDILKSIEFTGPTGPAQRFLASKQNQRTQLDLLGREIYLMEPSTLMSHLDSAEQVMKSSLDSAVKASTNLDPVFEKIEMAEIDFMLAGIQMDYPRYHKYFAQKEDLELPEDFDARLEALDLNQEVLLENSAYRSFLNKKVNQEVNKAYELDTNLGDADYLKVKMEASEALIQNAKIHDYLTYETIREQLMYYGPDDVEPFVQPFLTSSGNEEFKAEIKELQAKWEAITPGKMAMDFTYATPDGELVSLSDFRGKYVYIDVWATWCGPCKREIPSLEVLQETFEGQDLVFMSVSIDDGPAEWHSFLEDTPLGGVQVYAEGAWKSDLATHYNIKAIPRFMLIDPEGKIVSATASRPSDPETKEMLKDLLDAQA